VSPSLLCVIKLRIRREELFPMFVGEDRDRIRTWLIWLVKH